MSEIMDVYDQISKTVTECMAMSDEEFAKSYPIAMGKEYIKENYPMEGKDMSDTWEDHLDEDNEPLDENFDPDEEEGKLSGALDPEFRKKVDEHHVGDPLFPSMEKEVDDTDELFPSMS